MNKRTIKIAVKLFLSFLVFTVFSVNISGAVRFSGDDLKINDSSSDLTTVKQVDKISDEIRDSGIKEVVQSDEVKMSSYQPTKGSFSIQIAAFNDEDNASAYIANNKSMLGGYELYYKSNGDLYKVLIGHFSSIEEASYQLREVFDLGYRDTFVTELSTL